MASFRVMRPQIAQIPQAVARTSARQPSSALRSQLARRSYATGPGGQPAPKDVSWTPAVLIGLGTVGAIGGWYYVNQQRGVDPLATIKSGGSKIQGKLSGNPKVASGAEGGGKVDYQAVYNAIAQSLEEDAENYDDGSYGPVLVRLAWHASGTYDKNTGNGGSNGATMRFAPESDHGANAGLLAARNKLDPIKQRFPAITYSDLWTLAGVAAIQEMGGPKIPWRPGRMDGMAENCTPDGRLPDGDKGSDHLRFIFNRMGFNDQEIVALSGAHALGRCHTDRSGFDGPWTFSPITFSNEYYKLLFEKKWQFKKWKGPIQYEDKDTKSLMMLTTDMALTTDKSFKQYSSKYAKDESAFFTDFSAAFAKLLELGVPEKNWTAPAANFKTTSEQGL